MTNSQTTRVTAASATTAAGTGVPAIMTGEEMMAWMRSSSSMDTANDTFRGMLKTIRWSQFTGHSAHLWELTFSDRRR